MSRRRKKKKRKLVDDAHQPSAETLAMMLRNGNGVHQRSKIEENKRTGRLRGAEKRNIQNEEEES